MPEHHPQASVQSNIDIEQVERALDDIDMLKQLGLDASLVPHGSERLTVADIEAWLAAEGSRTPHAPRQGAATPGEYASESALSVLQGLLEMTSTFPAGCAL